MLNVEGTRTGRVSATYPNESNVPQSDESYLGSCTFLNMSGDITIVWDEQNREKVLAVIRKKMEEGYVFFTTKKFLFKKLTRRVKVTKRNINKLEEIIIPDDQFEQMVQGMNDRDVADLVRADSAALAKRTSKKSLDAMERANRAEDVIGKDSLAVRPLRGG